jgi:hypothetical protein
MGEESPGGWFVILVLLTIAAGIALAFWFFGVLNAPVVPQ